MRIPHAKQPSPDTGIIRDALSFLVNVVKKSRTRTAWEQTQRIVKEIEKLER